MKIRKVKLTQFRRFDNLTIDLGANPAKIIALLGPNGCGKSSVFDAFESRMNQMRSRGNPSEDYYSKSKFSDDPQIRSLAYNPNQRVEVTPPLTEQKHVYIRSSYRYTSQLNVDQITAQPEISNTNDYPTSTAQLDDRLTSNYKRLLAISYGEFEGGSITGNEARARLIGKINECLKDVLDIKISSLGNVLQSKGQLWFEKGSSKDFPYANLSAGEKEVLDLIIDLIVKTEYFNDTVYCIDEPELHLSTAVQRQLLKALDKLIPENCQLWIATHSIGFMRALQIELAQKTQILDFSSGDYFTGAKIITPITPTRRDWQRIFAIALDDLSELVSPKRLIYCEGRKDPTAAKEEQGLDADVYNRVFGANYPDTLFVSSGGCHELSANASVALTIVNKAFKGSEVWLLKDRDKRSDAERTTELSKDANLRIPRRHELENYLFAVDTLRAYCAERGRTLDEAKYVALCPNPNSDDMKTIIDDLAALVGNTAAPKVFLRELASCIKIGSNSYAELAADIFG